MYRLQGEANAAGGWSIRPLSCRQVCFRHGCRLSSCRAPKRAHRPERQLRSRYTRPPTHTSVQKVARKVQSFLFGFFGADDDHTNLGAASRSRSTARVTTPRPFGWDRDHTHSRMNRDWLSFQLIRFIRDDVMTISMGRAARPYALMGTLCGLLNRFPGSCVVLISTSRSRLSP